MDAYRQPGVQPGTNMASGRGFARGQGHASNGGNRGRTPGQRGRGRPVQDERNGSNNLNQQQTVTNGRGRGEQQRGRGRGGDMATDGRNHPGGAANGISDEMKFAFLVKKATQSGFRHEGDMKAFVLAALQHASTEDVVLLLSSNPSVLRQILQAQFDISITNRQNNETYSFERTAVPFCKLLSSSRFYNISLASALKSIYEFVHAEVSFFPRMLMCMEQLFLSGRRYNPGHVRDDTKTWCPADEMDILEPVCKLLFLILSRVSDAAADDVLYSYHQRLQALFDVVAPITSADTAPTAATLGQIETILRSSREKQRREVLARQRAQQIKDEQMAMALQFGDGVSIPLDIADQPGPGSIRPEGPRHDNDHEDYKKIAIVPTHQEILCTVEPYLPPIAGGSDHVACPVGRHLDAQFRFLREDMLAAFRRGVQGFFREGVLNRIRTSDNRCVVHDDKSSARFDGTVLQLFRNAMLVSVTVAIHRGVSFQVAFDQPSAIANSNKRERESYWKLHAGSRQLEKDSLVCLAYGVRPSPNGNGSQADKLIFATVADKNLDALVSTEEKPSIWLKLLDAQNVHSLVELRPKVTPDPGSENVLLQVRGHFFAGYEPVLRALQFHSLETLPMVPLLLPNDNLTVFGGAPNETNDIPVFWQQRPTRQINLTAILSSDLRNRGHTFVVPVCGFHDMRSLLHTHAEQLLLDRTQIDAFAAALCRRLCLIQGPPGTGKTYIGVHIVRALLANFVKAPDMANEGVSKKKVVDRINQVHEAGLTPLESVVRAGGRSQSELLSSRMLHELKTQDRSKAEGRAFFQLKEDAAKFEAVIDNCYTLKSKKHLGLNDMTDFLETMYPDHLYNIVGEMEDAEGFISVDDKDTILDRWLGRRRYRAAAFVSTTGAAHGNQGNNNDNSNNGSMIQSQNAFAALDDDANNGNKQESKKNQNKKKAKEDKAAHGKGKEAAVNNNDTKQPVKHTEEIIEDAEDGSKIAPRSILELENDTDVYAMTLTERRILWAHWQKEFLQTVDEMVAEHLHKYNECLIKRQELDNIANLRTLRSAAVVGFTTSGAAKHQLLVRALRARVVICEEAGEVLEPHILASLSDGTEQLILIGDHLQLRPHITEYPLTEQARNGFNLDISLFERLVKSQESAHQNQNLHDLGYLCTLDTQRRMRPQIADLLRATLYPRLKDSPEVSLHPPLKGFTTNLWFMNHNNRENNDGSETSVKSYCNAFEAKMVVALVRYLCRQGYAPKEIAVLTPYVGQLILLRKYLSESKMLLYLDERDLTQIEAVGGDSQGDNELTAAQLNELGPQQVQLKDRVRLSTVDNFQGEEAEVVLVSTVRNNTRGRTGFLKISNRVNVMLSRAKHGMIILGSVDTIRGCPTAKMFRTIVQTLENRRLIGESIQLKCQNHGEVIAVSEPELLNRYSDGGCLKLCQARLKCGHTCPRYCHPDDRDHELTQCKEPCNRILPCGDMHRCTKLCHEPCGGCMDVLERVDLPCGHFAQKVPCIRISNGAIRTFVCRSMVRVSMPLCGHIQTFICAEARSLQSIDRTKLASGDVAVPKSNNVLFRCTQPCDSMLPCNHRCEHPCGQCSVASCKQAGKLIFARTDHAGPCRTVCDRLLFCGHSCSAKTCHPASQCPPCKESCRVKCRHSHCSRKCLDPCPPCAHQCTWECSTNHPGAMFCCPMPCGSPCVRLPCNDRCGRLLSCNHRCPSLCGEPCPSSDYCRECVGSSKSQLIVDLILMLPLADHDPDDSPLLVLNCGHAFTTETLDSMMKIDLFYTADDDGKWNGLLPLHDILDSDLQAAQCPECRAPVSDVRRYGRILNLIAMRYSQRKFLSKMESEAAEVIEAVGRLQGRMQAAIDKNELTNVPHMKSVRMELIRLGQRLSKNINQCLYNNPYDRVYELERSTWADLQKPAKREDLRLNYEIYAPSRLPPSLQPVIALQRAKTHCDIARLKQELFFDMKLCRQVKSDKNQKGSGKPGKQVTNNAEQTTELNQAETVAKPERTTVEIVQEEFEMCMNGLDQLVHSCEQARSLRSLQNAHLLAAVCQWTYLEGLHHLREVEVAQSKDIRSVQTSVLDSLLMTLDSVTDDSLVQEKEDLLSRLPAMRKRIVAEFYEPLTEEEKRAVYVAMGKDVGTGVGSFGGHWYECPNGHVYTIGECGGAMQQSVCPECKEVVGGSSHHLQGSNRVASSFLQDVGGQAPPEQWRDNAAMFPH